MALLRFDRPVFAKVLKKKEIARTGLSIDRSGSLSVGARGYGGGMRVDDGRSPREIVLDGARLV